MKKIRVALLCHMSNPMIRENLDLYQGNHYPYRDLCGWNNNIVNALSKRDDIELHVISPHIGMKKWTQSFENDGVKYYFFCQYAPLPWRYLEAKFYPQNKHGFYRNRKYVKSFLNSIKPDIVNLIGAENSYYSIAALDVESIPVLIHCQTVYANPEREKKTGQVSKFRWDTELQLFHKTPYLACNGSMYYKLIKQYEPNAIVFPRRWPAAKFPEIPEVEKQYDFVYFARFLNRNKGFDNAIEAMGKFIKAHPEAKLLAVGRKDTDWPSIEKRINDLGLVNSVIINEPITEYVEMLKFVRQGRLSLLPITMDVISGTILESMRMGMPVLTCKTSGTPSLNEKRETVLISEIADSDGLCANMMRLYESSELQELLRQNGYKYINEMDEDSFHNIDVMVAQYRAVIDNYYHQIPIPSDMLFDSKTIFI